MSFQRSRGTFSAEVRYRPFPPGTIVEIRQDDSRSGAARFGWVLSYEGEERNSVYLLQTMDDEILFLPRYRLAKAKKKQIDRIPLWRNL